MISRFSAASTTITRWCDDGAISVIITSSVSADRSMKVALGEIIQLQPMRSGIIKAVSGSVSSGISRPITSIVTKKMVYEMPSDMSVRSMGSISIRQRSVTENVREITANPVHSSRIIRPIASSATEMSAIPAVQEQISTRSSPGCEKRRRTHQGSPLSSTSSRMFPSPRIPVSPNDRRYASSSPLRQTPYESEV